MAAPVRFRTTDFFEPVDVRDIGMVERGQHLRFALEARQPLRVVGEQIRHHFERDIAIQLGI